MTARPANYGALKAQTLAYLAEHPNSTSAQAAEALGVSSAYIRSTARRSGGKMANPPGAPRKHPVHGQPSKTSVPRLRIKTFNGTPEQYDALAHKLPLEELGWQDCRWPIGDPKDPDFGFCGHAKAPGKTRYCQHHFLRSRNSEKALRS